MKTKIKQKKCAFKGCGEKFTPTVSSAQMTCRTPKCALGYVEQQKEEKEKKRKRKITQDRRQYEEENKSVKKRTAEVQIHVNLYVRMRDFFKPCISCGKSREQIEKEQGFKTGGAWDAGHYISRGHAPQLRFNLKNIHKQCKSCNGGSGRFSTQEKTTSAKYRANLVKRVGVEAVEFLENDETLRKFDREYCDRAKAIFRKKARIQKKRVDQQLMFMEGSF